MALAPGLVGDQRRQVARQPVPADPDADRPGRRLEVRRRQGLWIWLALSGLGLTLSGLEVWLWLALLHQASKRVDEVHEPVGRLELAFENEPRQPPLLV